MPAVDILVFAPHPDDAELCCGGLLLKARQAGLRVGVVDVTRGEMATRGTVATRRREAAAASRLLGVHVRENLGLPDGRLHDNETLRQALIRALRRYRPSLLLTPHWEDQHPDHAAVGQAGLYAAWLAGAPKYDPRSARGVASPERLPYRPRQVLHYNNRYGIQADIIVDISDVFEQKLELARCYKTQFGPGGGKGAATALRTRLSDVRFFDWLRGLHAFYGYQAGVRYGEPYCVKAPLCVEDVALLCGGRLR
ncbi:MAG: bacillithiol biosynthesis deacetylase BshB1 [Planctomycetota bacterium]|nr:bacillithiol biosynthesis deacetylase BshB1 [Planctomycetota bacterium]